MKSLKFIFGLVAVLFLGTAIASETGMNPLAVSATILGAGYALPYLVTMPEGIALMAVSPDVTLIAGYAGDHKGDLFKRAVFGMEAARAFTVMPNVKDQTPLLNLVVSKGLRPYDGQKQMESELKYGKRTLKTGLGKKELAIDVQKYRNTYLSKYLDPSANSKRIPFPQFTNEAIIDEFGEEINESVPFFGLDKSRFSVLVPGNVNAAGTLCYVDTNGTRDYYVVLTTTTAGDTPSNAAAKFQKINGRAVADGLQIQIEEAITSTELAEVTVGQIDNSTVYATEAFKTVFRSLPAAYRSKVHVALCSYNTFDLLQDDIEEKQKYTVTDPSTNQPMDNVIWVPGTSKKLMAIACGFMGESERIIVTQKTNLVMGTDLESDANQIKINPDLWTDEMGLLMNVGFNWALSDDFAINDRD